MLGREPAQQQPPDHGQNQQEIDGAHGNGPAEPSAAAVQCTAATPPPRPLFFARFCAGWVYASQGTVAASLLEKQRRYEEAVELLQLLLGGNACLSRRGTWWCRLSINLEHLKQVDAALEVAEAALADPYVRHDVPGVFQSPFQAAPLDLDTDAFFPARASAIERRLQDIALGGAGPLVQATWETHYGALCRGVSWSRFSLPQLLEISECIGGVGLSVVFRLMAEDHAGSSGGLPDLLLWRTTPHRDARLVEVKGPTDRLSEQQRAWIAAMSAAGLQVE
ncbi:hypothetical protein MNEG_8075, partial [Monoraphidium neglectum]